MEYKYDVTLSFAGEDRNYVDKVANLLKEKNVKVFYDKFEEEDLWGKDLAIHFDTIYRKSARFCIPFISKHYKEKIWTKHEVKTAISRAIESNSEYILPVKFDDTEIEGIRPTISFLDLRKISEEELVNKILLKLGKKDSVPVSEIFQEKRNDVLSMNIYYSMAFNNFDNDSLSFKTLRVTITNTLEGPYRYFYSPSFKITIPFKGANGFELIDILKPINFPIKLEQGEEIKVEYKLQKSLKEFLDKLDSDCEYYAICSTTVGEKFETEKQKIESLISSLS